MVTAENLTLDVHYAHLVISKVKPETYMIIVTKVASINVIF